MLMVPSSSQKQKEIASRKPVDGRRSGSHNPAAPAEGCRYGATFPPAVNKVVIPFAENTVLHAALRIAFSSRSIFSIDILNAESLLIRRAIRLYAWITVE